MIKLLKGDFMAKKYYYYLILVERTDVGKNSWENYTVGICAKDEESAKNKALKKVAAENDLSLSVLKSKNLGEITKENSPYEMSIY